MLERSQVPEEEIPDCGECREELREESLDAESDQKVLCENCPWGRETEPLLGPLLAYIALQDAGCPLGRHELRDEHWRLLPVLRAERDRIARKEIDGRHPE